MKVMADDKPQGDKMDLCQGDILKWNTFVCDENYNIEPWLA